MGGLVNGSRCAGPAVRPLSTLARQRWEGDVEVHAHVVFPRPVHGHLLCMASACEHVSCMGRSAAWEVT